MELQCPALEELKGLASGAVEPEALSEGLTRGYGADSRALAAKDPGAGEILAAARLRPVFALGMLAQALDVPVESQSAAAFAGRQAWLHQSTAALAAAIPERLAELDKQFAAAQHRLVREELKSTTAPLLTELSNARRRNAAWVILLGLATLAWIYAAVMGLERIHELTKLPVATGSLPCPPAPVSLHLAPAATPCIAVPENASASAWGWAQWSERLALYLFLMTAFSWGMRWLGRMINDAWSAGQSAARRWVALSVVLADDSRRLVKDSEKDYDRIRCEVFGDKDGGAKSDEQDASFSLEQVAKMADLLKKLKEVFDHKAAGAK